MATRIATVVVAIFVPVVLLVNGVGLIAQGWFVRAEYSRLPADRYGMSRDERVRLAQDALSAVAPWGEGKEALGPEFGAREVRHLGDVRTLLLALFAAHAAGVLALAALAVSRRTSAVAVRALLYGTVLTLGIAVFAGVYLAINPVSFLGGFHRFFFSGDSWRFAEEDTLRRLFPDRFWAETGLVLGVLTALQTLALGSALWLRHRQASPDAGRTPKS